MDLHEQVKSLLIESFEYHLKYNYEYWFIRLGSVKKTLIYLRNRSIENVLERYIDSNLTQFYSKVREDLAECGNRASHYGVSIGQPTGKIFKVKRKDYNEKLAGAKCFILNTSKSMNLVDESLKAFA